LLISTILFKRRAERVCGCRRDTLARANLRAFQKCSRGQASLSQRCFFPQGHSRKGISTERTFRALSAPAALEEKSLPAHYVYSRCCIRLRSMLYTSTQSALDAVYIFVVPWSEFPIVPSYPHYPLTIPASALRGLANVVGDAKCQNRAGNSFDASYTVQQSSVVCPPVPNCNRASPQLCVRVPECRRGCSGGEACGAVVRSPNRTCVVRPSGAGIRNRKKTRSHETSHGKNPEAVRTYTPAADRRCREIAKNLAADMAREVREPLLVLYYSQA